MQDAGEAGRQAEASPNLLRDHYLRCYREPCAEVPPCRDARLLERAAQYLRRDPGPSGFFTLFPFYQALGEHRGPADTDRRSHLRAFIKATELLETLCVNMYLQPWKKEFKTLKTFTGPYVYYLLPVLSSSTIQSVLASIGYFPHNDAALSEFRLGEDANPDRAILVGFELLLARVECHHLLDILEKDQLGPQEWMQFLQHRVGPAKQQEPTDKKTTIGQKEEEKNKGDEGVAACTDTRPAVNPVPKPRRCRLVSQDQSIIEMQRTYPDLAFRGRPLVPDKPLHANSSRSSIKGVPVSTQCCSDDSKAAELLKTDCVKGTKATCATVCSKLDGVLADSGRASSCNNTTPGTATCSISSSSIVASGGSRAEDEHSGPQAISLHITLRAGTRGEQGLRPGEGQATAEHSVAGFQNKRVVRPKPSPQNSEDEEWELRELAERMDQLHLKDTKEEVKRKGEMTRRENAEKERREKERKTSTEGDEQSLRKPVVETVPAPSHDPPVSNPPGPALMREQTALAQSDCLYVHRGEEEQGRVRRGRREEEQIAQGFVIVEHHIK